MLYAKQTQSGGKGIAVLILSLRGECHAPATLLRVRGPIPLYRMVGGGWGPVWMGLENLVLTGVQTPDRPASSEFIS
jgi:hypothetical protein